METEDNVAEIDLVADFEAHIAEVNQFDDIPDMPENSKFRFAGSRILLTYKTQLDKKVYKTWAMSRFKSIKEIIMAHETGDTGYDHTHVFIKWSQKFETRDTRCFDFDEIHPNIKKIVTNLHETRVRKYLTKQDPDNKTERVSVIDRIWNAATAADAVRECARKPADVTGIIAAYNLRPADELPACELIHNWQVDLAKELEGCGNHRKIIWIFDKVGNTGKTLFSNYMEDMYPNDTAVLNQLGGTRDGATCLASERERG